MALARPRDSYPQLSWWGWGNLEETPALPESITALLAEGLGVREPSPRVASLWDVALPDRRLAPSVAEELVSVVGTANASGEPEARVGHAGGKSLIDLLRMRSGDASWAPDLVVYPGTHEEVLELLLVCASAGVAVVPFGGGTSVVGGLRPAADGFAGVVALDTRRMDRLVELDEESRLAVLEPGLRGPQAEELLSAYGYTIGHFPQSFEHATIGGFAAARSSGQASAGYGRFDELVLGLRAATPAGTLKLGRAPKSAAGPDLRQLILGSEGSFGVLTELTVQVRPAPQRRVYEGWRLESFARGIDAVRRLAQDGPLPTVLRLSDEAESAVGLARPGELGVRGDSGALAIVGYEGSEERVAALREAAGVAMRGAGAKLEADAGEAWASERFRGPYLRDALLDAGALVETLETATFWSSLEVLYRAVSDALREQLTALGTPPVIMCHVSHVYPAGASLYFTVACAMLDDPVSQWLRAKRAATEAIVAGGGSISHHHGVGTDHRKWISQEIGELGVRVLRAVKAELDPEGVLNPGVLIPQEER